MVLFVRFRSRQTFVQLLPSDQNEQSERTNVWMSEWVSNGKWELNKKLQRQTKLTLYIYRWYFLIIFFFLSKLIWFPCTLYTFGIWCANRVVERIGMHVCAFQNCTQLHITRFWAKSTRNVPFNAFLSHVLSLALVNKKIVLTLWMQS